MIQHVTFGPEFFTNNDVSSLEMAQNEQRYRGNWTPSIPDPSPSQELAPVPSAPPAIQTYPNPSPPADVGKEIYQTAISTSTSSASLQPYPNVPGGQRNPPPIPQPSSNFGYPSPPQPIYPPQPQYQQPQPVYSPPQPYPPAAAYPPPQPQYSQPVIVQQPVPPTYFVQQPSPPVVFQQAPPPRTVYVQPNVYNAAGYGYGAYGKPYKHKNKYYKHKGYKYKHKFKGPKFFKFKFFK